MGGPAVVGLRGSLAAAGLRELPVSVSGRGLAVRSCPSSPLADL